MYNMVHIIYKCVKKHTMYFWNEQNKYNYDLARPEQIINASDKMYKLHSYVHIQ